MSYLAQKWSVLQFGVRWIHLLLDKFFRFLNQIQEMNNCRERAFILMMLALDRSLEVSQVSETCCEFRIARVSLHLVLLFSS